MSPVAGNADNGRTGSGEHCRKAPGGKQFPFNRRKPGMAGVNARFKVVMHEGNNRSGISLFKGRHA